MQTFLTCKMIKAEPMLAGEFAEKYGASYINASPNEEGYAVIDENGNRYWEHKARFEEFSLSIENPKTISIKDVADFTGEIEFGKKGIYTTTADAMKTKSGFDTFATSSCVNPEIYDQEKGNEAARRRIYDKIFGHLGFMLKWAQNGLGHS